MTTDCSQRSMVWLAAWVRSEQSLGRKAVPDTASQGFLLIPHLPGLLEPKPIPPPSQATKTAPRWSKYPSCYHPGRAYGFIWCSGNFCCWKVSGGCTEDPFPPAVLQLCTVGWKCHFPAQALCHQRCSPAIW